MVDTDGRQGLLYGISDHQPVGHEGHIKLQVFAGYIRDNTCTTFAFIVSDNTLSSVVPILRR